MSIYSPDSKSKKLKQSFFNFLLLFPFTLAFLGMAFALAIEPHMKLERTAPRLFRVTGSNHLLGHQFYSKTIDGVEGYRHADASRNDRHDSMEESNRRSARKRLVFDASNGRELSWSRTADSTQLTTFIQSTAPELLLIDTPPWWRKGLALLSFAIGVLVFIGTIQNCFFAKKTGLP